LDQESPPQEQNYSRGDQAEIQSKERDVFTGHRCNWCQVAAGVIDL